MIQGPGIYSFSNQQLVNSLSLAYLYGSVWFLCVFYPVRIYPYNMTPIFICPAS